MVLDRMVDYQSNYVRNTAVVSTVLTDQHGGADPIASTARFMPAHVVTVHLSPSR